MLGSLTPLRLPFSSGYLLQRRGGDEKEGLRPSKTPVSMLGSLTPLRLPFSSGYLLHKERGNSYIREAKPLLDFRYPRIVVREF